MSEVNKGSVENTEDDQAMQRKEKRKRKKNKISIKHDKKTGQKKKEVRS